MSDTIWQGATWRRVVTIVDEADAPVDPTELLAVMCPETAITVTQDDVPVPGLYYVTLTHLETAELWPGETHWDLFGLIGSDWVPLVHETVWITETCVRPE